MGWAAAAAPYIPAGLSAIGSLAGARGGGGDKSYEGLRKQAGQSWQSMLPGLMSGPQINQQLEAAYRQQMQQGLDQQYNQAGQQLARTGLKGGAPQVHLAGLEANANVDADSQARLQAYDQANQQYQQRMQLFQLLQSAAQQRPDEGRGTGWGGALAGLAGAAGQAYGVHQGNQFLDAINNIGGQQKVAM